MSDLANATWWPWATLSGAMLLLGALIFVAWWALFADRSGNRRRCPRCWHDLSHSPGMRCGECGHAAASEAELHRTRRRLGLGLLAIVGCAALGGYVIDDANAQGWFRYVPSRALVWMYGFVDADDTSVRDELIRRMRTNRFGEGDWLALLEQCAAGQAGVRPPSEEWQTRYGRLAATSGFTLVTAESLETRRRAQALLSAIARQGDPSVELATRAVWPSDVGPTVDARVSDWWDGPSQMRVVARPRLDGSTPSAFVLRDAPIQTRSFSIALPPLAAGVESVEVEIDVERRGGDDDEWTIAWTTVVPLSVRRGSPLAETLEPVSGEAIDRLVAQFFGRGLVQYPKGSLPVRVGLNGRPAMDELFRGTALAARLDVLRNGRLARRLDIWGAAGPDGNRQFAWEVPMWDDEILAPPTTAEDRWQIRVRSAPELALRVPGVSRYWEGDLTVDVDVKARRGHAPARGWLREDDVEEGPTTAGTGWLGR